MRILYSTLHCNGKKWNSDCPGLIPLWWLIIHQWCIFLVLLNDDGDDSTLDDRGVKIRLARDLGNDLSSSLLLSIVGVLGRYRLIRYGNQVKVKAPKMASLTFTLLHCSWAVLGGEKWTFLHRHSPRSYVAASSRKTSPRLTCFVRNLTSFA